MTARDWRFAVFAALVAVAVIYGLALIGGRASA